MSSQWRLAILSVIAAASTPLPVLAQTTSPPASTHALGFGESPAAGGIGVEYNVLLDRARFGFAAGAGIVGVGMRFDVTLNPGRVERRATRGHRLYVGVGYLASIWDPIFAETSISSLETGVQFWPRERGHWYLDLGAGVASVRNRDGTTEPGPVLRLLFGSAR